MLQIRLGLMAVMASLAFIGCTNQDVPKSSPSPNNLLTTTTATTDSKTASASPAPTPATPKPTSASPTTSTKAIAVGDIKEIEGDTICGKTKVMYAHGETSNYRVYICADTKEPDRPRYYISRNKDGSGGLDLEAMNYNPQKDGAIEFNNDGYIYTLESPTTQNPEPVLRVTFPNKKLTEEKLLRYLTRSNPSKPANNSAADPLQYVLQNRESLGVCKGNFRTEDGQRGMGSKAFQITDKKYLVQVMCFLAAYQGNFEYVLWIDEAEKPRVVPLEFDSFQEPKEGEKPKRVTYRSIAGLPRFNVRSQTMTNFTKFRGLGDCGSSALYKLEGDRMVLQEYRAKYACDGNYVQDLPIIYP